MRAFVAIEIDEETRRRMEDLQNELRRAGIQDVTWVKPFAMHLTLQFLGEISHAQCETLQEALRQMPAMPEFWLEARGAGAFPFPSRASVLWAGIEKSRPLEELADAVRGRVKECGIAADFKLFSPHLTLGRIRNPRRDDALAQALAQAGAHFQARFPVREFVLMESRLTPRGPLYRAVERFSLAAVAEIP